MVLQPLEWEAVAGKLSDNPSSSAWEAQASSKGPDPSVARQAKQLVKLLAKELELVVRVEDGDGIHQQLSALAWEPQGAIQREFTKSPKICGID